MLKSITLQNFRKHADTHLTLDKGFVLIRGENEQGKTTLLEGVMYGLFGSKHLRSPLDETVTTGQPASSLKVTLCLEVNGKSYTVTRSKGGAEINYEGQSVTGQTETASFMEKLLGCSAAQVGKLIVAPQGETSGILQDGAAKAHALIEALANLEVIPALIDGIMNTLPTGNTKALLAQRDAEKEKALAALPEVPQKPSDIELNNLLLNLKVVEDAQSSLPYTASLDLLSSARGIVQSNANLAAKKKLSVERLGALVQPVVPTVSKQDLEAMLALQANSSEAFARWQSYCKKPKAPDSVYPGTREMYHAEVKYVSGDWEAALKSVQQHSAELVGLQARAQIGQTCGVCLRDFSTIPEAIAKSNEVEKAANQAKAALAEAETLRDSLKARLSVLETYKDSDKTIQALGWAAKGTMPETYEWEGDVPTAPEDYTDKIRAARKAWSEYEIAETELAATRRQLQEVIDTPLQSVPETGEAEKVITQYEALTESVQGLKQQVEAERITYGAALASYNVALQARSVAEALVASAKKTCEALEAQIKEMDENNVLVKKLREARPVISSRLWSAVLATVSSYFTKIRGEPTVVARGDGGFTANGLNVNNLSGSAQDALGLAIRLALVKTFMPTAPFVWLDEPFSAMAADRECNVAGLLATLGFEQVLAISHSDRLDSFANQVVTL